MHIPSLKPTANLPLKNQWTEDEISFLGDDLFFRQNVCLKESFFPCNKKDGKHDSEDGWHKNS